MYLKSPNLAKFRHTQNNLRIRLNNNNNNNNILIRVLCNYYFT